MTIKETSLTPLVAGRQSPLFLRPSAGFHKLLRARGDDVIGCCPTALSKLCLARILHQCGGRSKRQTQWVWRQASERLLFNRNNKIVSKGDEVSKIKQGVWCPRRAAGFVKEGQCSRRKGPGKGAESGGRTRSPSRVQGARFGGFL